MKNIDLCGFGNGIVDLQFEVEDEQITNFGYEKGQFLLVEAERQSEMLKSLAKLDQNQCSGGSAANTVIAFRKFGGSAAYLTVLGKDEFGKFYSGEFEELGIELRAPMIDDHPTGTCIVLISKDAERTMLTNLGATSLFAVDNLDEELISRSKWLYIEGYELSVPHSAEAALKSVEIAKKHNTKIAVTFSDVFITNAFKETLRKIVDQSDLVFCNHLEAMSFTESESTEKAIEALKKSVPAFALTRGIQGSFVHWNGNDYEIKSVQTTAVDTTGAGDVYAGGFLYGIIAWNDPEKAGKLASLAASRVVSQMGARLAEDHQMLAKQIA